MRLFLVISCAAILAQASTFNVDIKYTCLEPKDPTLPCRSWSQIGAVEQETSCYPGEALVWTGAGVKAMKDLQVGDFVLGHNAASGKDELTQVRAWLHRFTNSTKDYLTYSTDHGSISVSDYHNVAKMTGKKEIKYVFAKDMAVGTILKTPTGTQEIREAVGKTKKMGMYAPLTGLNNFYVGQTMDAFFLSHSFAHIANPTSYEFPVHLAMSAGEYLFSNLHEITNDDSEEYVHPVAKTLSRVFPFMLSQKPSTMQVNTKRQLQFTTTSNQQNALNAQILMQLNSFNIIMLK